MEPANIPVPQVSDNAEILKGYQADFEQSLDELCMTEQQMGNVFANILFNPKINSDEGIEKFSNYINALQDELGDDPFPLYHKFGGGMYTREIHMPKGYAVIGKMHSHDSMVYMLTGKVIVADKAGTRVVEAPAQFVSKGGIKRVGYVLENVIWIDIHATDATTVGEAEKEIFVLKDESYSAMIDSLGVTEKDVREISENTDDIIFIDNPKVEINKSAIEGEGVFAVNDINAGEEIGISRIGFKRTNIGRFTNHSFNPNTLCVIKNDVIYFIATKNIMAGEEVTIDYPHAKKYAEKLDTMLTVENKGATCRA